VTQSTRDSISTGVTINLVEGGGKYPLSSSGLCLLLEARGRCPGFILPQDTSRPKPYSVLVPGSSFYIEIQILSQQILADRSLSVVRRPTADVITCVMDTYVRSDVCVVAGWRAVVLRCYCVPVCVYA